MTTRAVAIRLKIPDNEAFTALAALARLGVDVTRIERAEIWRLADEGDGADFLARFERNESLFNSNKHEAHEIPADKPRAGELWVEMLDAAPAGVRVEGVTSGSRCIGWRLFGDANTPCERSALQEAAEKLLCNPAIERAIYGE